MPHEFKRIEFKFAEDSPEGVISGYGAVFGNVDSYGDVIEKGAFKDTLREWEDKGKYPPMLLQHGGGMFGGDAMSGVPIGVWTSMQENSKGLKVQGKLLAMETDDSRRVYEAVKAGALDGLSIGYEVREAINGTKPGEPRRKLTNIDLWELSVVTFPANDRARISGVKAAEMIDRMNSLSDAEDILREAGLFSRKAGRDFVSRLAKIARREAGDDQVEDLLEQIRSTRKLFT